MTWCICVLRDNFEMAVQSVLNLDLFDKIYELRSFVQVTGTLGAKNVILLGDFNAGGTYIRSQDWETNRLRGDEFNWLIPDHMDTTTTNTLAAYDRLRYYYYLGFTIFLVSTAGAVILSFHYLNMFLQILKDILVQNCSMGRGAFKSRSS